MDRNQLTQLVDATVFELRSLLRNKGGEYASDQDVLANFKRGAALVGVKPLTCLFIYLSKHYDAIATFVRDKEEGKDRTRTEPIAGRLDDLINYCLLAKAIIAEEGGVFNETPPMTALPPGNYVIQWWGATGEDTLYIMSSKEEQESFDCFIALADPTKANYWNNRRIKAFSRDSGANWTTFV